MTTVNEELDVFRSLILLEKVVKEPSKYEHADEINALVELCQAIVILRQEALL